MQTRRITTIHPLGISLPGPVVVRSRSKPATQVKSPGVVGTNNVPGLTRYRNNTRSAVGANIVKGPSHTVVVTDDEQRMPGHIDRLAVTGIGHRAQTPGKHPGAG